MFWFFTGKVRVIFLNENKILPTAKNALYASAHLTQLFWLVTIYKTKFSVNFYKKI